MRQRQTKRNDPKDLAEAPVNNANDCTDAGNSSVTRSWLYNWLSKCLTFLKYACIVLVIPPLLNYASLLQESAALMPQGAVYDVGFGQKMFMACNGTGLPTVILDAPTGMSSDVWTLVFQEISKSTKVCMYDRAGLGFSERPHEGHQNETNDAKKKRNRWQPYTVERMVDDLHHLITFSSQQQRPLILVGAEMGALVARFFTQVYESDVTDVVLIEPLPEDLFSYESNIWVHHWSETLVARYQLMQLSAAVGLNRLALLIGATDFPMSEMVDKVPQEVINRQKHLLCSPRHLSTVVDEHYFINETFSQMQTVFRMKSFPKNVSVTVISGDYHDDLLPSGLNKAWAMGNENLVSKHHPDSKHIKVKHADRKLLYHRPDVIVKEVKRLVRKWRTPQPQSS